MDIRRFVFRARGLLPIPFILTALYWAQFNPYPFFSGLALAILGEYVRIRAVMFAGGATRTRRVGAPGLVTTGPYAVTRNPLYLANLMIYIGFSVASGALSPYLPLATFVWFTFQYALIISLEEGTLYKLFGRIYNEYQRTVPRIFPRSLKGWRAAPNFTLTQALWEERSTLMSFSGGWLLLVIRMFFRPS